MSELSRESRLQPDRHGGSYDVALRAGFLRHTLQVAAVVVGAYLLQGALGLFRPRLFPWDAILGLGLVAICAGLYRQGAPGRISLAASWLVAGVNVLAAFYSQLYGVRHPVTAIYLVGIVLAGMLIGGWFLRLWSAMGAFFILLWAYFELVGATTYALQPVTSWPLLGQTVLFWWALLGVTAWLIRHFAFYLERAAHISRAQTETLTGTVDALAGEPEPDTFLRQILSAMAHRLEAQQALLFMRDARTGQLAARLAVIDGQLREGAALAAIKPPAAHDSPLWQEVASRRGPLLVENVHHDERLMHRDQLQAQGVARLLFLPVGREESASGFVVLYADSSQTFAATEIELAQALAQQGALALQLAALAAQKEQSVITGERNRMAREIHDTLAQGFTGILIQLEAAEDLLEDVEGAEGVGEHLARARLLARESLQEARRSVQALRPQALAEQDLSEALRQMVQRQTEATALAASVVVEGEPRALAPQVAVELLRIAQEALTNVQKHSGASTLRMVLSYGPEALQLTVEDDGRGFDEQQSGDGFGLTSMRERAALSGGKLSVESQRGIGTRVVCRVPLPGDGG